MTPLTCGDGATIWVDVAYPDLWIVMERSGEANVVTLPYPSSGYGGHELLLSPKERYLAMWLYSGQSEVGYELFELRPSLRHLGGLPYVYGEGFGPVFSADERWIALAWATNAGLYVEDEVLDEEGCTLDETVVEWATVRVQELPHGATTSCDISVRVPAGFPFEGDDVYYPKIVEVVHGQSIHLNAGWGPIHVPLRLPEAITVPTTPDFRRTT